MNPFGEPEARIFGDFPFTVWKKTDNGHQGVWRFEDYIELYVPNSPVPDNRKEIWLQMTYSAGYGHQPLVVTLPYQSSINVVEWTKLDQYYWHVTYHVIVEPNPVEEMIYIQPRDCTLYLDEIVLDTLCIPEPASLLLLAVAGLLFRRR